MRADDNVFCGRVGGEKDAEYQGISSGLCSPCCVWNSWIVCWDGLSALVRVNVIKVVMIARMVGTRI